MLGSEVDQLSPQLSPELSLAWRAYEYLGSEVDPMSAALSPELPSAWRAYGYLGSEVDPVSPQLSPELPSPGGAQTLCNLSTANRLRRYMFRRSFVNSGAQLQKKISAKLTTNVSWLMGLENKKALFP